MKKRRKGRAGTAQPERDRLTPEQLHKIEREVLVASNRTILPSVAAVVTGDGLTIFSGTFVQHEGKRFVLTARHCLEDLPRPHDIIIHSTTMPAPVRSEHIKGVFWCTSPDDPDPDAGIARLDIGLIWLTEDATSILKPTWLELSRLGSAGVKPGGILLMPGFPGQMARVNHGPYGHKQIGLELMIYIGQVTNRSPGLLAREAVDHIDVFIEYDQADLMRPATKEKLPTTSPLGMSGCGLFVLQQITDDGLWTPGALECAGIQSSFIEGRGMLRATKAEFARRALQDFCSGIRDGTITPLSGSTFEVDYRPMPDNQE